MSLTHPNSAGLLLPVLQLPAVAHELRTPAHYTQNTQSCSRLAAGPLGCGLDERGPFEGMTSYVTKTLRRVWSDHLATQSSLRRVTSNLGTFAEPNELATNSRSFWLAARCPGLAGNGQYCGETVALWYGNIARRSKPDATLSHSWATFSVSPTGRALLVNGGSSACRD
jgi:hypothetical protein